MDRALDNEMVRTRKEMSKPVLGAQDIVEITMQAATLERRRCLRAVDDEPELDDDMPDELWECISGDRAAITEALRSAVRATKAGIRDRIMNVNHLGDRAKSPAVLLDQRIRRMASGRPRDMFDV